MLLTLIVYWLNMATPPMARLGVLYIIPVLLVTWTEGWLWGIVFGIASIALREAVAWGQIPNETLQWRIVNGLATWPGWRPRRDSRTLRRARRSVNSSRRTCSPTS
jgi:hypothetical protein